MKNQSLVTSAATILNREFQHPADGWYMIEPKGEHPNRKAEIVQVIDDAAIAQIVNRFNADAAAGQLSHGSEMLVDHEHFASDQDKESRAYGWLTALQSREDGIYGKIRWTGTGKAAVDGGDYRFFSTEYLPSNCEEVRSPKSEVRNKEKRCVRPLRLDGLTLTNSPNNKGGKPITNRGLARARAGQAIVAPTQSGDMSPHSKDNPGRQAGTETNTKHQTPNTKSTYMKSIATKLGLAAEASEEAVLDAVTKVINRADEATQRLTTAQGRVSLLETENGTLIAEQIEADFAAAGIKDEKIVNRHKGLLSDVKHFKNRAERVEFITELTKAGSGDKAVPTPQRRLNNRDTKPPAVSLDEGGEKVQRAEATKIQNRACELQKQMPGISMATAYTMAQREMANN